MTNMRTRLFGCASAILLFAGCAVPTTSNNKGETGFIQKLPDGVVAIAAPYQNLSTVRVLPEDGCYWYLHVGPVENTLLPLRTTDGRPICTASSSG